MDKGLKITIIILVLIILFSVILIFLLTKKENNNIVGEQEFIKNEIVNDHIEITESMYFADEYEKDYTNITDVEIYKNGCNVTEELFKFTIIDNKLNVKNMNTDEVYVSNKLINIKSFVYINSVYTGCGIDQIVMLTNDGKIYQTSIGFNTKIDDITKIDELFEIVDLPIVVSEIGIIENLGPALPQSLLIKDNEGNQYHFWGNDLAKLK